MKFQDQDEFLGGVLREKRNIKKRRAAREHSPEEGRGKRAAEKKRETEACDFRCRNCGHLIGPPAGGTRQRNHCPVCLYSLHLDENPGDRASSCRSVMEPIAIWVRDEEWVLLHRCRGCGEIKSNRVAPDDNELLLVSLAARPLGRPAFPLGDVQLWKWTRE